MRSNPAEYQMVAPGTLQGVVSLLAAEPGGGMTVLNVLCAGAAMALAHFAFMARRSRG